MFAQKDMLLGFGGEELRGSAHSVGAARLAGFGVHTVELLAQPATVGRLVGMPLWSELLCRRLQAVGVALASEVGSWALAILNPALKRTAPPVGRMLGSESFVLRRGCRLALR